MLSVRSPDRVCASPHKTVAATAAAAVGDPQRLFERSLRQARSSADALGGVLARAVQARARDHAHPGGCCCASCASPRISAPILQRVCLYCNDLTCNNGSKCKRDPSFGGIFDPTLKTRTVDAHKYTKKDSKRGVWESEHMMPSAAWKASGLPHRYQDLPTMSIPYETHRGGVSGAGGGVTSTGSSSTAQGWSAMLGQHMQQGNTYEAFRLAAVDAYNSALMSGELSEAYVSQIIQVILLHAQQGHLSQQDAMLIRQMLIERWYSK